MELVDIERLASRVRTNVSDIIVGKNDVIDLAIICLIASGHMLFEDVPGTAKTLFAKAFAKSLGCSFRRIQFTPDLLPSDITGINFYNQKENQFKFRPGPAFANIILADEINRATPRTQSALLECMEERQITIDGETMPLKAPFFIMATQNPIEIQGTFPLPEAQLDRFLIKTAMGYPSANEGIEILDRFRVNNPMDKLEAITNAAEITDAQQSFSKILVSRDIMKYIIDIAEATRSHPMILMGVSPRGTQALLKASQVQAILKKRLYVSPDDVKAMAIPVLSHRIILKTATRDRQKAAMQVIKELLDTVSVPKE
ncbi:MAG: AAA family ATPase [Saccharofermentanales bacterium]